MEVWYILIAFSAIVGVLATRVHIAEYQEQLKQEKMYQYIKWYMWVLAYIVVFTVCTLFAPIVAYDLWARKNKNKGVVK